MKKVFIVGTHRYRTTNPVESLLESSILAQCIAGEELSEQFEAMMNSTALPDAIILSEPLYEDEHYARPAILEHARRKNIPTLVLGPISWRVYIKVRNENVHFHTSCSLSDLVKWIQHVCP